MNVKPYPEAGTRFGRLVVLGPAPHRGSNRASLCICDCGKTTAAVNSQLVLNRTTSCGCSRIGKCGRKPTHGHHPHRRPSPEWSTWKSMRERCSKPTHKSWADYGGRGIAVCDRWLSFENFLADMGPRPPRTTLDRIDGAKGYEPSNCRWATHPQQQQNRRSNKIDWQGVQEVRGRSEMGERNASIAHRMGLGEGMVSRIVRGVTWKEQR